MPRKERVLIGAFVADRLVTPRVTISQKVKLPLALGSPIYHNRRSTGVVGEEVTVTHTHSVRIELGFG